MGSFSMQCSVSGLGISGGTPVRCLLVTESPYDGDDPRKAWIPRTAPIRAENNDYGSICNVHPDDVEIAKLWLRGLREDAVERGLGDNACHDVAVSRDMTMEQLLVAIQERRLEVIQDARSFWRFPKRDAKDVEGAAWEPPLAKRVTTLLESMEPGCVGRGAGEGKYVVDEPVPYMARVRFGRYELGDHRARLEQARTAIGDAGLACVITAGTGRYAREADLLVFPAPREERGQHVPGPQWDMRRGASADHDKSLRVGLVMIREDVWQAMLRFPHSEYVSDQYPKQLAYEHKLQRIQYGAYVWFRLDAFKFSVRKAWAGLRRALLREPVLENAAKPEAEDAGVAKDGVRDDVSVGMHDLFDKLRKQHEERRAAMTDEERAADDAQAKERAERYDAEEQRKRDHPFFGDFRITSMHHDQVRDLPGAWQLVDSPPGVIGIGDHLSMLLADKVEPWDGLLDSLAELAAVRHVLGNVGVVLRPSESSGPQYPEWGESARFARMVLDVATAAGAQAQHDPFEAAPASMDEVIQDRPSLK